MSIHLNLTPAERREAWLRISSILTHISKAAKSPQKKLLDLERKMASELIKQWRETYDEALKDIFKSIPDFVSKEAMELLSQGLLDALGPAFGSSKVVRNLVDMYVTHAYSSAKSKWTMPKLKDKDVKSVLLSLADKKAIAVLTRHNCFWLGEHYGKRIGPKVAKLTQQALDEGMGRDALAEELRQTLGGAAPEGYTYWDVVASSALVRARSFGTISGMEEAGITEYEVLAMGDERMCDICGTLSGTVFSVAETRKVIDKALDITDPEKFKAALPWHTKSPKGKSTAQLTADGQSLPPFHGRCRCTLVMVGGSEAEIEAPEPEKPVEMIRGVPRDQVDRLRGARGHAGAHSITPDDVRADYRRVGIDLTEKEAQEVYNALHAFSGSSYRTMRISYKKDIEGKSLTPSEAKALKSYKLAMEYTNIAPTYKGRNLELYRGIRNDGGEYYQKLVALKPGDSFDLEMASSFSSTVDRSLGFAGKNGIILHVASDDIKDAPSIKGISQYPSENEVLVNDRLWEVTDVSMDKHGYRHITMRRKG